ncbi:hypothetical protein [Massilia sp. YMA4]|uniref:DUF2946 domain-containing protein n=1 Tax=[Empedobacter] haloabium TaxID=592317 RepID=A0ABZ1URK2_9BURK|nr:hypothetical protein [Massilia sp. YMA4]
MKRTFSTFILWLLIAILPLNASATRLACCWPAGDDAASECEQHRNMTRAGDTALAKHRAPVGERCSHCSLCCAPAPALQRHVVALTIVLNIERVESRSQARHSSRTRDRLERPPKLFFA